MNYGIGLNYTILPSARLCRPHTTTASAIPAHKFPLIRL